MTLKAQTHRNRRIQHWDSIARIPEQRRSWGRFYHRHLNKTIAHVVQPGSRVLEIGCGHGDLLADLKPSFGVGVDFSESMIALAHDRHPKLNFAVADAHNLPVRGTFDAIILSDLVNDLWDVQEVIRQVSLVAHSDTRIIITAYNRLWEPLLTLAEKLKLARPLLKQNWLSPLDIKNLLYLEKCEIIRHSQEVLWPLGGKVPNTFFNRFLVRFWPFKHLALTNLIVGKTESVRSRSDYTVSIVIPARNESGNIARIIGSVPKMGLHTELIFVEGHSTDDTYARIIEEINAHPEIHCHLYKQRGKGKADAVRLGFEMASGEILMILDADLTVSPDQLVRFYNALVEGKGELINGVRLVYPREKDAMRFFNLLGNKFFSMAISWLLDQPVKDTLCGTKVLWRNSYDRIVKSRPYFGDFDPFGDFDLLFNSARLCLKIVDLPVRYGERTYGETNIHRWKHGAMLLRMLAVAALRIKFR